LNAGLIDENEARRRRENIAKQADFYGAMDGASKFIRGDAIAGLLITAINIIGGIVIGVLQHNMSISDAAGRYTVLTIGDGLISQLPALTVSTAAGLIITRSSEETALATGIINQMLRQYQILYIASAILLIMAFVPGMPFINLVTLSLFFFVVGYLVSQSKKKELEKAESEKLEEEELAPQEEITIEDIEESIKIDMLELKIGYGLISFVDEKSGGDLLKRIKLMRKQIAGEFGVIVSPIHIRDDLNLERNDYVFLIKSVQVAQYSVFPDRFLAMKPGGENDLEGIQTKEPAFGLPAVWINSDQKSDAISKGYTIVDPVTVIITHMTELIKSRIADIFTRQDADRLIESIKGDYPKVVEELMQHLSLGNIYRILKNLLSEWVPIRDMLTISETLADYAPYTKDMNLLTEYVRTALAAHISNKYKDENGVINVITLGGNVEGVIMSNVKENGGANFLDLPPNVSEKLLSKIQDAMTKVTEAGIEPIILTSPKIRLHFKTFIERFFPKTPVLAYSEITEGVEVRSVGVIEL